MVIKLGILEGDGIGHEIVPAARRVLRTCETRYGLDVDFVDLPVGWEAYESDGTTLPDRTAEALGDCDGWLLGPVLSAEYPDDDRLDGNPSGALRTRYDLYANIRPVRSYPGVGPDGVDLTIFRQNTEGFYADRNLRVGNGEFMPTDGTVLSLRVVTERESRRIAERAFKYATSHDYSTVTAVHKANVLQLGDGLFLDTCRDVAAEYPDVALDDYHVDAFAMELVRDPTAHRVVVTTNMFGDILSDEAAGLVGSLGLAPSLNVGDEYGMAQAVHGAAPDIAGDGIANPTAMILSTQLLLEWLGQRAENETAVEAASRIEAAVRTTIAEGAVLTPDLGGDATTTAFTDAVVEELSDAPSDTDRPR